MIEYPSKSELLVMETTQENPVIQNSWGASLLWMMEWLHFKRWRWSIFQILVTLYFNCLIWIVIHPIVYTLKNYIVNTYYVPDSVLSIGKSHVLTRHSPCFHKIYRLVGEAEILSYIPKIKKKVNSSARFMIQICLTPKFIERHFARWYS